ncbi:MAG: cell division protein ZapA [Bacteroidales bacterium]|nr:cell division protein ZapA [Bacteroidales bacterium]
MEKEEAIHITIAILQRHLDLWVKKEHEYYYKEAEKRINEKAADFAKKWNFTDQQDLLSKLLLDLTVNYIAKEEKLNGYEENLIPRLEKLTLLADQMGDALDALESEVSMTNPATATNKTTEKCSVATQNVD